MLWINVRKQFERGKLYERDSFFWTTVFYEIQWLIKVERYFKPDEKEQLYDMIWYLFWTYEYHWQQLSARQISYLLWVDHKTVDRILDRAKYKIKSTWMLL